VAPSEIPTITAGKTETKKQHIRLLIFELIYTTTWVIYTILQY